MSNNIPNEILLDIFRNLDRNEVEKCQLISQKWNWNFIVNKNSLSLRKIYSMNIGRKYATSSASEEELFVSLTLYDKEKDEYSEIELIGESNEEDRDEEEQEYSCLKQDEVFSNQKPINRTMSLVSNYCYTFDFARIKSLKYCVVETIKVTDERWPIKSLCPTQKILDKLTEVTGSKISTICYNYDGYHDSMSIVSNYLNIYKFKFKCFVEYSEDDDEEYEEFRLDNFFTKPPVIPTPPLRISVDFLSVYDSPIDAIKNLKLHGPSRYSLYFPISNVDHEFFTQLLKHYQNANPEELPKTVKFVNHRRKNMNSSYYNFIGFLKEQGYKNEVKYVKSDVCKYCNEIAVEAGYDHWKSYSHGKRTYEIRKTDLYVIQIQYFVLRFRGCKIIPEPDFICRLKYRVQLL